LFGAGEFFFEGAVVGEDLVDVGFAAVEVDEAVAVGDGGEAVFVVPGAVEEPLGVVGAVLCDLDEPDGAGADEGAEIVRMRNFGGR